MSACHTATSELLIG